MKRILLGVLLGMVLGIVLAPVAALTWLRLGKAPVAVADSPLPLERWLTGIPLHARIGRELAKAPMEAGEEDLVTGARVYSEKCAACHGFHGKPSLFGARMFPVAPPLWEKHPGSAAVGVSDDPPGETYWKVANGIRLTGMPAFRGALTDTEMWQVSLLTANANKPLPPAAVTILRGVQIAPAPSVPEVKK